ncbi:MAG TPA: hypothetical protein DEP47_06740 [Chloroflexi bacterium]|nr:hypothetical protein [Chloroflexota bacterium]
MGREMALFDFYELVAYYVSLMVLMEKLSRSAGFTETLLWICLPSKRGSRDTTSAEGAVGCSGC